MNRSVKAFLAIAIAIVYPGFVYLAAVTFMPDKKSAAVPPQPVYPTAPACSSSQYNNSGLQSTSSCAEQEDKYQRDQIDYQEALNKYDASVSDAVIASNNLKRDRSEIAIVFGLFGLAALYFIREISALVIGFCVASTTILVTAVANLSDAGDAAKNPLASVLSLASFLIIVIMIWLFDNVLYPKKSSLSSAPVAAATPQPDKK